jgi:hypothetical protein
MVNFQKDMLDRGLIAADVDTRTRFFVVTTHRWPISFSFVLVTRFAIKLISA